MRFNILRKNTERITNHAGGQAFKITPELELYTAVVTASLSDKFYEKADDTILRLRSLIDKVDPLFVAQLAIYAREQMNLRTIPLVLTVELAKKQSGNALVGRLAGRIIQRADEITELLAYYVLANDRTGVKKLNGLSKQLQKGLAIAFNKFDEYQFAKYNRDTAVAMKDALFLVHPKAKDEQTQLLFDKIAKDELQTPYTWEVQLSELGQQQFENEHARNSAIKDKWEELILSNRLGYMATLRNLRNILSAKVSDEAFNKVCAYLADARAVAAGKQLPFRYLSAYRELQQVKSGRVGSVLDALEKAAEHSASNIAGFGTNVQVVVAADVSGSMGKAINSTSKIENIDIGLMLAMLLQRQCRNVITGIFGDTWKTIGVPRGNVLANTGELRRRANEVGYSTNGYLVIKDLVDSRLLVDKIMLFTDCQLWNSNQTSENIATYWGEYRKLAPAAKLYLFDLAGYGQTPLKLAGNGVCLIGGWSDKIFGVLQAIENGSDAIAMIRNIDL